MIRKAVIDDANEIATLIVAAMGSLANKFTATESPKEALKLFVHFVSLAGNQYSFENTLVYIIDDKVVGAVNAYDGAKIEELRKPFLSYLNKNYHNGSFRMETESEAGEFYIDTLSVNPNYQGKGIGKALLTAAKNWAAALGHLKIGLLVDLENAGAKRLYQSVGFAVVGEKLLLGEKYEHLSCQR